MRGRVTPPPNPLPQGEGEPKRLLLKGLTAIGIDSSITDSLLAYLAELEKWNSAYNLTAVRGQHKMVTRHLLDSLVLKPYVRGRLIDVGSGAGLPGIPLAIADPALAVTVLDGNGKKARFLRHVVRTLKLGNVEVVEARAEDFQPPEPYTAVVSRAFGGLHEFLRLTAHLLVPGGQWLAMKGKLDDSELKDLPAGAGIVEVKKLKVPGLDESRHLVIVARK